MVERILVENDLSVLRGKTLDDGVFNVFANGIYLAQIKRFFGPFVFTPVIKIIVPESVLRFRLQILYPADLRTGISTDKALLYLIFEDAVFDSITANLPSCDTNISVAL